jgi:hypothetical protein
VTTNPFDFDHEDGDASGYAPQTMPDPASLRVPDDPGELMEEDEDEEEDPDQDLDDRDSYSM